MSPKAYRALGAFFIVCATVVSVLNLKRTVNLGWGTIPFALIVLGFIMLARAKAAARPRP
jgi:hypothetical protein